MAKKSINGFLSLEPETRTEMRYGLDLLREATGKSQNEAENARELYVQDRKFRVVREGARFEGIVSFGDGSAWAGYSRPLQVGEIITCDGWKPGMDDTDPGVNWTAHRVPEDIVWLQVWPMDGLFRPYPMKGFLEPVSSEEWL